MAAVREARRSPQAAARMQRRASLLGGATKARITNLSSCPCHCPMAVTWAFHSASSQQSSRSATQTVNRTSSLAVRQSIIGLSTIYRTAVGEMATLHANKHQINWAQILPLAAIAQSQHEKIKRFQKQQLEHGHNNSKDVSI